MGMKQRRKPWMRCDELAWLFPATFLVSIYILRYGKDNVFVKCL